VRAILTWHSIDGSGSPVSVDPDAFARQVDWLAAGPVRVVPLDRLAAGEGGDEAVALTFDDAFRNFADEAAPRLLDRGLPVTLFVVTGHAGGTNAWGGRPAPGIPELPLLDWDALGRLAERGVAIGSHTRTHPRLSRLGPARLDDELGGSAERLARELGAPPRWLAYPFGDESPAVRAAAARWYAGAVTTDYRPVAAGDPPLALPRLDAWYFRAPGALEGWGGARFRRRLWVRRQARRARALARRAAGGA
jgi:peptidoglycan/xylan/chitin deacetylase (PgdA/CDA1 family)